ncbi:hypothetical protein EYF80_056174 [Liparis tanakae]|uniref:Uncharacterized protein n=1 Tax=Liparis tanakae TaxID=230148 RepID=A0A4Z2EY47_9TELE|nr:hypothetical protein EYF80_056174 [Liparis tanakae]
MGTNEQVNMGTMGTNEQVNMGTNEQVNMGTNEQVTWGPMNMVTWGADPLRRPLGCGATLHEAAVMSCRRAAAGC